MLIGISGIPGSGKTTLAATVSKRINELFAASSPGIAGGGREIAQHRFGVSQLAQSLFFFGAGLRNQLFRKSQTQSQSEPMFSAAA